MKNLTYRQLQTELKYYRDECGIPLGCKLNAKKAVLEAEYLAIYNTEFANDHPEDHFSANVKVTCKHLNQPEWDEADDQMLLKLTEGLALVCNLVAKYQLL